MTTFDPHDLGLEDERAFSETVSFEDSETVPIEDSDHPDHVQEIDPPNQDEKQPSWAGKRLAHFRLLRPLGHGGMGMVIQAQDINLGRIVALKVLRKQIKGMDDYQRVDQFLREARAAAQLEHPNAAHIYEINQCNGWWYIATEMIEGGTLWQIVKAAGKLAPEQACPLIADAASVLAAAHQLGIIHRDVKPQNLMLTRKGRCKVVDFGLVRVNDPNDPFDFAKRAVGTPDYMPPEATTREKVLPAYDVYSLGASLYFMLAGKPPFKAKNIPGMIQQHKTAPRPDIREANPACSERLANLITSAMAIDPAERPSAADVAATLRLENIGSQFDPRSLILGPDGRPHWDPDADTSSHTAGLSSIPVSQSTAHPSQMFSASSLPNAATQPISLWAWTAKIAIAVVAVFLLIIGFFWAQTFYMQRSTWTPPPKRAITLPAEPPAAFAARFPNAPATYGTLPESAITHAQPIAAPAFSWAQKPAPEGARFVAHELGQTAYPLGHPLAPLIPADQAAFYIDKQAVAAAGLEVAGQ